jgi:hypothetical protein
MFRISFACMTAAFIASALAAPAGAQQPSAPQPPQSPNMTFFVTSVGPGKGADLGGIEAADRYCQQLASTAGAGEQDVAGLSQHASRRRQTSSQCA